ncbi:hypothetical protein L202_01094 [Cryptococcus amylolentus CBS 6039]|uniref:Uncharacterized protein n=1 Tax=Cryptococcus amylolentus CBS 6039 TaxID=1295533 RepID=A0A1E3I2Q2_9TREE|nr:hypothetical protein L202_01094 [Cryptococcus amylolentus CBS 6039]ODN82829.1 hypothetical protein L202_01094 [Cryptococcus amylolentus CBS 6039]
MLGTQYSLFSKSLAPCLISRQPPSFLWFRQLPNLSQCHPLGLPPFLQTWHYSACKSLLFRRQQVSGTSPELDLQSRVLKELLVICCLFVSETPFSERQRKHQAKRTSQFAVLWGIPYHQVRRTCRVSDQ